MKKIITLCLLAVCGLSCATPKQFVVNAPEGSAWSIEIDAEETFSDLNEQTSVTQTTHSYLDYTVVRADGFSTDIRAEYSLMEHDAIGVTDPALAAELQSQSQVMSAIVGKPFYFTLDSRHRVNNVWGLEQVVEAIEAEGQLSPPQIENLQEIFSKEQMQRQLSRYGLVYPVCPIEIGDTWFDKSARDGFDVNTQWRYIDCSDGLDFFSFEVTLIPQATMHFDSCIKGTIGVDHDTGINMATYVIATMIVGETYPEVMVTSMFTTKSERIR